MRWLSKSGLVARATPDWRLRRNGIFTRAPAAGKEHDRQKQLIPKNATKKRHRNSDPRVNGYQDAYSL